MRRSLATALVIVGGAVAAAPAQARDGSITSFDQTEIAYHFYPARGLEAGAKAPVLMYGPGYAQAGAAESNATVSRFLDTGYNVLTWDPRGFGASTGNVMTDSPDFEGRDAQLLVDMLAQQPEVQLDAPGDPRLGMIGASYGGGIQNVLASMDGRVDAIAPQIAWHSLVTSLYKSRTPKGGWGSVLYGVGTFGSTGQGLAQFQFGRQQDPQTTQAIINGLATGHFSDADVAYFDARGPKAERIAKIKVPTLISQGTDDTLFTLAEAIKNYEAGRAAGVPISMNWFCGGLTDPSTAHGVCTTPLGPQPGIAVDEAFNWMERWVKRDSTVDLGPGFRWVSDTGELHYAEAWPVPQGTPVTGEGKGTLAVAAGDVSGAAVVAMPAANALTVPLATPPVGTQMVGEPQLELRYSGTAASADGVVYAQLIDEKRGLAIGNQVTPVPVTLDGAEHTITLPLEAVAVDTTEGSTYSLQITGGSTLYFAARQAALLDVASAKVTVPTVAAGASSTDPKAFSNPTLKTGTCKARRYRIRFAGRRTNYVRAKVRVDGKLVKTVRRRHIRSVRVRIIGAGTHTVRIKAVKRNGKTKRVTRRLVGCAAA